MSDRPRFDRTNVALVLERTLLASVLAASLAAVLLAARNGLVPAPGRASFGLTFWLLLLGVYTVLALGLAGSAVAAAAAVRRPGTLRWLIAVPAALFPAAALYVNRAATRGALDPDGPLRWLGPAILAASLAGLGLAAAFSLGRRWGLRLCTVFAVAATLCAQWPDSAPPVAAATGARSPVRRASVPAQSFLLIGIDGADWRFLDPLIARGDLPHLAALRRTGAFGPLRTLQPTLSPAVWTTVATGVRPRRHGVRDFMADRLFGSDDTLPDLRPLRGLGFRLLLDCLRQGGHIASAPVGSATRRVPAYWNIATALGAPVGVVGWWATAPADPVLGHVVSDRLYFETLVSRGEALPPRLTFPEPFAEEMRPAFLWPEKVPYETAQAFADVTAEEYRAMQVTHPSPFSGIRHELTYFISVFETTLRLSHEVLDRQRQAFGAPGDLLVLFRIVDKTSHTALQFSELVDEDQGASPEERRAFRRVVTGAYQAVDRAVGELRAAFPEANTIVVSDHGFEFAEDAGAYNHRRAPDGVFLAVGPAFRPGRVEGLSVYDILPLLLYLKGFPQAADIEGTLPTEALDPEVLRRYRPRRVATYGDRYTPRPSGGTKEADAEMVERLRALGYVQ